MQIRALRSFRGRYGFVRKGLVLTVEDSYARGLIQNRLAEVVALPVAPRRVAFEQAPVTRSDPPGDGAETPSSAPHRGRRSRRKTSTTSEAEPD